MRPLTIRRLRILGPPALAVLVLTACSKTAIAPSNGADASARVLTLSGTVFDRLPSGTGGFKNGAPVPGVRVNVTYTNNPTLSSVSATTEADGTFRLPGVRSAEYFRVRASKDGYELTEQFTQLNVDTTLDLSIAPVRTTLTGTVVESAAGGGMPVAGARLEILDGSNAGRTTATDATGAFAFPLVWGEFDLAVSSPNHEMRTVHTSVAVSARLDVELAPKSLRTRTTLGGALCTVEKLPAWLTCTAPVERSHMLRIDRAGPMTVTVNYDYVGDYYLNYLTVEMRCGNTVVFEKQFRKLWDELPTLLPDNVYGGAVQLTPGQPCVYELRVFKFIADTKGGSQTRYRVDVDYPR